MDSHFITSLVQSTSHYTRVETPATSIYQVGHQQVQWRDYKLSGWEDITFSHALTKLAQSEYQRRRKVPCWILRFVLHTLSIEPPTFPLGCCELPVNHCNFPGL
jgi:hypothetical protein